MQEVKCHLVIGYNEAMMYLINKQCYHQATLAAVWEEWFSNSTIMNIHSFLETFGMQVCAL